MISALSEIDSVIRCIELGAEDYLSKPFNPTLLRARIGATCWKRSGCATRFGPVLPGWKMRWMRLASFNSACCRGCFRRAQPNNRSMYMPSMEPAREVGGDLYDCFYAGENTFCFLVGDVSGKGASAAMFMARTRSLVRMTVDLWRLWRADTIQPGQLMEAVNRELCQNNDDRMFVTLFLGLLDTQTGVLSFVNAGHPAPHLLRAGGDAAQIDAKPGLPLGVRSQAKFERRALAIQPGDALFVCSDGVVEALNEKGDLFSIAKLNQELCAASGEAPIEIVRLVKHAVATFTGAARKADDVTALALRWRPAQQNDARRMTRSVDMIIHNDLSEIALVRDALDRTRQRTGCTQTGHHTIAGGAR